MKRPVIEKLEEVLGVERDSRAVDGSRIEECRELLNEHPNLQSGGCCDASMVAESVRRGEEYR